jgi:hypothetical protein
MKLQNSAIAALLFLATCSEQSSTENTKDQPSSSTESSSHQLGTIPASETGAWQRKASGNTADARYLQAAAFDEARKVLVMFGGMYLDQSNGSNVLDQDTWEWSPATGKWTNRTLATNVPDARSGAAMAYDSDHAKIIMFGGRAGSGYNLEDTWEWDPTTGAWTDVSAGTRPPARSQHAMVYEKSSGKVLLFGGGRSDTKSVDGTGISLSFDDTWEYDPVAKTWAQRTVTAAPSKRNDSAMVWDATRKKAVLFGGMMIDIAGATGVPKQDTWEWDPAAGTWTERTAGGAKPTQRYGHSMAFDGTRNKVLLFGGLDMGTGMAKSDVWEWDPTSGAWSQRMTGTESDAPTGRLFASMVSDDARDRMLVVAGATANGISGTGGKYYPDAGMLLDLRWTPMPSREVWELDPVKPAFTNRTPPLGAPSLRYNQAMAFNPSTGKTCVFGGSDSWSGQMLNDYWEWDGTTWTQVPTTGSPSPRAYAAMAYDPVRKSLILFGGVNNETGQSAETWELTSAAKWVQLTPATSPAPRMGQGMVTDTTRNKILMFGGLPYITGPIFTNPEMNDVWEWDGATANWTDRTPPATSNVPLGREFPALSYDQGRQKLFLYDGFNYGSAATAFSEWDPITGGWAQRSTQDYDLTPTYNALVAYDSIRRRHVIIGQGTNTFGTQDTWEADTLGPTWYVRSVTAAPFVSYGNAMAFDSTRGVVVFMGGTYTSGNGDSPAETWEYKVTGWGNGTGCTAASQCASGFCADGVCCDVAACTGACKSCNVPGSEGTCKAVVGGTEVAGSCESGKACDGTGSCKAKNSVTCTSAAECASGFCVDGVCCDSACDGTCASCNQAGRIGKCTPYQAGTDPKSECAGTGTGTCQATCDGVGHCSFPSYTVSCGNCLTCDGNGSCTMFDQKCYYGYPVDGGWNYPDVGYGGAGGDWNTGGSGGYTGQGGAIGTGGRFGVDAAAGGAGGSFVPVDSGYGEVMRIDGGGIRLDGAFYGEVMRIDGGFGGDVRLDGAADSSGSIGAGGYSGYGTGGSYGGLGVGGSGGIRITGTGGSRVDAGNDAGTAKIGSSGCSCELGNRRSGSSASLGGEMLFVIGGLSLFLVRRRRRH